MAAQIITSFDIDTIENKILSNAYFDPEESRDQLDELFNRFLEANSSLHGYLDNLFKLRKGLGLVDGEQWITNRQKAEQLRQQDELLLDKLKEPEKRIDAVNEWLASLPEREALQKSLDAEVEELASLNDMTDKKLEQIQSQLRSERVRFNEEMTRLKKTVWKNRMGIFIVSFLVSVILALILDRTGLDTFSNDFLTILQVLIVFLITEFGINWWLKQNTRAAHRPELKKTLLFLKEKFAAYNQEIDRISLEAGIERRDLFYEMDKLFDRLQIKSIHRMDPGI